MIWATQVLENLIKRGMPSRAEITDIAMAERAECVMINKGPFVLDAIAMLDDVVERMRGHQHKNGAPARIALVIIKADSNRPDHSPMA